MSETRIFVKTLGCKVNTYDSHALINQLSGQGFSVTDKAEDAQVAVINSCSVTNEAEKEARYLARRYRRNNPDAMIVVTGCYAQTDSQLLSTLDEVNLIVPNENKPDLAMHISNNWQLWKQGQTFQKIPRDIKPVEQNKQSHFKSSLTFFDKSTSAAQTRAFVKIQDGCNNFCTYCIIPYARGTSRSVPPQEALQEITRLVEAGTPEIVLTGIHIGDYGVDLGIQGESPFAAFIEEIFQIPGLTRLRISSLEPAEVSEDLIRVLDKHRSKFCDHFHLPLQSGNDQILKRMRRQYTSSEYFDKVSMIRSLFPNSSIGADVIPGFPDESDDQHASSLEFIEKCQLNYLHVFPYSKRPNTAAAKMPNHIDAPVVKARAEALRSMSTKFKEAFYRRFIGTSADVVWEQTQDRDGRILGTSRNYLTVVASPAHANPGRETKVHLKGLTPQGHMLGTV
jgi:threonylcarbamoyladenosine tRNA methylthiotransferase MtaB